MVYHLYHWSVALNLCVILLLYLGLADFGFSKDYLDERNCHIPFQKGKPITGTARYISINNHQGKEVSRRDDMEALMYMCLFLHKGELPWQGIVAKNIKEKYKQIGEQSNLNRAGLTIDFPP